MVKITADENGRVVIPSSNNPEMGYIRVEQEHESFEGGFYNKSIRSALISGQLEALNAAGFKEGQVRPGKIIAIEQTTPFYEGQQPKINPQTEQILLKDGKPIYRQTMYTENMDKEDKLLQHDTITVSEGAEEEKNGVISESIT